MTAGARIVNPQYLVETDWLAAHLADPDLRIFDCTTYLDPDPVNVFLVRSGRPEWEKGHIPGAGHLDLQGELSDAASPFRFTMPSAEQFAAAMSRHGVAEGSRVVLYSAGSVMWAARIWWMLRAFGFDNAAVLNGGFDKWKAEGRPLSTEPPRPSPARFLSRPRPEMTATKSQTGAAQAEKVITYWGGGIGASTDAFVLALLGHDNVALYDGSLSEWVKDPAAPMETGPPAHTPR